MDDQRLGALFRAVRVRRGWTQAEVARRAGVSRSLISLAERGHLGTLSLGALRTIGAALDVRVDVVGRWRGGEADRLINARHSAMHDAVALLFADLPGWKLFPEVSFAIYGERGWIDILAWHAASGCLLIIELKTELVDVQELLGTIDRKHRLAARIARERSLPAPTTISRWVVLADGRTNRRHVGAHSQVLRAALPDDGRRMRSWLRRPSGSVAALSFLPDVGPGITRPRLAPARRVRTTKVADG